MKAGDIKKCLDKTITSTNKENAINLKEHNINDNFLLNAFSAYRNGETSDHIKTLVNAHIVTEELTVLRRVAVLKMTRDILAGLAEAKTEAEKLKLKALLTAYFI